MRGIAMALVVPVVFVLGVRFLMTTILQSENRNADHLLKGLIQGILVYHAMLSANQTITVALFLGIGGRLIGDFTTQRDRWKLASTLLGVAFGVLMADVVSYLYDDKEWTTIEVLDDMWDQRTVEERTVERSHRPKNRRRVSEPRRIEELPTVFEELSSLDSHSRVEDAEGQSDVEKEVTRLRAKALHAAGQRRRFREERKWAWSQGNFARAFQLRWQVKKYHALADSFTREADQKLIEADRAKRNTSPMPRPPPQEEPQYRSDREPSPFVQVVVERGAHEYDAVQAEPTVKTITARPASKEYKVRIKTISRVTKYVTKLKPGMQIDSRGLLMRSGHTKDASVSVGSSDPPTSDTWSRQLD